MNLMSPLDYLRALAKGTADDPLGLAPHEGQYAPVDPALAPPPVAAPTDEPTPYSPGYRQPVG